MPSFLIHIEQADSTNKTSASQLKLLSVLSLCLFQLFRYSMRSGATADTTLAVRQASPKASLSCLNQVGRTKKGIGKGSEAGKIQKEKGYVAGASNAHACDCECLRCVMGSAQQVRGEGVARALTPRPRCTTSRSCFPTFVARTCRSKLDKPTRRGGTSLLCWHWDPC